MLKFLTQKLRTHSLNEESVPEKVDEHDSGTESDEDWEHPDSSMASRGSSVSPAVDSEGADGELCSSCRPAPAHRDSHYDHHSSEEELEVINNIPHDPAYRCETSPEGGRRIGCGQLPEKRKWAQIACTGRRHENDENTRSSDGEECAAGGPVRFRTSPPLEALKPPRPLRPRHRAASPLALHNGCGCSAPPHKVPHYDRSPSAAAAANAASPRKRSRHTPRRHHPPTQRPCLDFDKMQQLKVHAVTAWRHGGGEHGGELSVFCW